MKKKIGVVLACLLTSALCAGVGSGVTTALSTAENTPDANSKTAVFSSPNKSVTRMAEQVAFPNLYDKTTSGSFVMNAELDGEGNPTGKKVMPDNGVGIYTDAGSCTFQYDVPVQMGDKTKDDILIECYPLIDANYATMDSITITLTDTANADNTVSMYTYSRKGVANYTRVNYAGKSLALSNERASAGRLHDNDYGAYASSIHFKDSAVTKRPIAMSMDYAERKVYMVMGTTTHMILDLDEISMVGKNSLWQGFENDEAYISVSMTFIQPKEGGCVVKSVLGNNLDGKFEEVSDYAAPEIKYLFDQSYLEEMPVAGLNVPYKLPETYAFDWYFGEATDKKVEIWQVSDTGEHVLYTKDDLSDGYFTAKDVGEFEIRYTVKNQFRTTQESLPITVVEELAPIIAVQEFDYATPTILQSYYIPKAYVYGGSGILNMTETLYYNGVAMPVPATRQITLDKAGAVALRVQCTGYTGEALDQWFPVEIPEATVLSVQQVPKLMQTSVSTKFPAATAYNSATGEPAEVKIYADGVEVGADRLITSTKTSGSVEVKYVATSALGNTERVFNVPIHNTAVNDIKPTTYVLQDQGTISTDYSNTGLQIWTEEDGSRASWAYPVVTGAASSNAYINFALLENVEVLDNGTPDNTEDDTRVTTTYNNFEYVDIVFTDFKDETNQMFVRVYRICELNEKMCYVQINGAGTKYLMDGSLNDANQSVQFYINTASGYMYNSTTYAPVTQLPGFTAEVCTVSVRFGGVSGLAGVRFRQIGNQSTNARTDRVWTDKVAPMVLYSRVIEKNAFVSVNSTIIIPAATAYDLRATSASVKITVLNPSSESVYTATNPTSEKLLTLTEVGTYVIQVEAEDANGGSGSYMYYYKVVDETAPVLTIEKTIVSELKLGSAIRLPNATATDNMDGECKVFVYISNLQDGNVFEMKLDEVFVFNKTGEYMIRYFTYDSDYNMAEYIMYVTVRE